ncbi:MAG: hypothetical protein B6I22_13525 [Desulfobacteraceae bacterium 4572_123]|nr:MAG: hypothetical protein B6I22_13525 [Desulfobacteraceae bacterium 4572_123]
MLSAAEKKRQKLEIWLASPVITKAFYFHPLRVLPLAEFTLKKRSPGYNDRNQTHPANRI